MVKLIIGVLILIGIFAGIFLALALTGGFWETIICFATAFATLGLIVLAAWMIVAGWDEWKNKS